MAGPEGNLSKRGLDLYLGCNGYKVITVTYDMDKFLRSCVDRCLEVAGDVELKKVAMPGIQKLQRAKQEGLRKEVFWSGNLHFTQLVCS